MVHVFGRAQRGRGVSGDRRGRRSRHRSRSRCGCRSSARPRPHHLPAARGRSHRLRRSADRDLHRSLHARDDAVARVVGVRTRARRRRPRTRRAGSRCSSCRRTRDPAAEACRSRCRPTRTRRSGSRSTSTATVTPGRLPRHDRDPAPTGTRRIVPIELEVFDFTLPDENSMHAMLFYPSDQAERYQGRNLDRRLSSARASPPRGARRTSTTSRR